MTHAETICAALAAADLAEERGDFTRARELLLQVEEKVMSRSKTLAGVAPPAAMSAPQPPPRRETPEGRYRVVGARPSEPNRSIPNGRYRLVRSR